MFRTAAKQTVRKFTTAVNMAQCKRLEGKVAIVTASTEGIGFSIAKRLAQEGAKVTISSRKEENVRKATEELKSAGLEVSGLVCHVGKAEDRKRLFDEVNAKYGVLDILVSNAAVNPYYGPTLECSESVWDKVFDTNVKSTFLLMKEALPLLRKSKSASITLVSSFVAYQPFGLLGVYSITKTTLLGLCKVTAEDLASEGIRVNCIAPGIIKTKFSKLLYESEAARETALNKIAMRRFGEPDDIAGTAAFLASDDASYITGEAIIVSGGMQARL